MVTSRQEHDSSPSQSLIAANVSGLCRFNSVITPRVVNIRALVPSTNHPTLHKRVNPIQTPFATYPMLTLVELYHQHVQHL